MNRRDENKSGPHHTGVTSTSVVRGPEVKSANLDGERTKSPRPKPAASPPLPETYGIDEVEILCKDPWWYFAYWEVTELGLESARKQLGPSAKEAKLILRVFSTPTGEKGSRDIRDVPVQVQHGRRYLEVPRGNPLLRVAIGLLSQEGYFAPIAHSSLIRVPPQQPSSETAVEWLHVLPPRGDGQKHERILKDTRPAHEERELPWRTGAAAAAKGSEPGVYVPGPADHPSSSSTSSWHGGEGGASK